MSAIKYLKSISTLAHISDGSGIKCENAIFRLHCKFTVCLLIGSSVLLTATEFFGKPINCISNLPKNVINTYCWISSTFTMNDYSFREVGTHVAAPGVAPPLSYDDEHIQEKWRFHNYYQWVVFFLCFQAFICYLPMYVWKMCEGGLMKSISESLSKSIYKEADVSGRKSVVIRYILCHLKMHNGYVFKYWACEVLCFVNIIFQLFVIDSFLGGEFMNYGFKVLEFSEMDQEERVDPMIYVFPRMTKCMFYKFGPSGTLERNDAFCLLAQNILNEKIFILIWFWFIILATLLGALLLYRAALIFLPAIRPRIIYAHTKMVPMETLNVISRKSSIGDWWIFYLLAGTLDAHVYRDILMRLAKEMETTNNSNRSVYPNVRNGETNGSVYSNANNPHRPPYGSPTAGTASAASAPPSSYAQSTV